MVQPPRTAPRIFVSHSHADNDFGIRLVKRLRSALGDETAVWYDAAGGLGGGEAWWDKIKLELRTRPVFIVILSPEALASKWVQDEINIAWRQKNNREGKHIIPLQYRPCEIPVDLATLQVISFLSPDAYELAFKE